MPDETQGGEGTSETKPKVTVADLPPEALTARLAKEREAGARDAEKALAAKLGISVDDAATQLAEFKKFQDAQKSEQQKLIEDRDRLAPRATRADQLEKRLAEISDATYGDLTDDQKKIVDDFANIDGVVDHDLRISTIAKLRKNGVFSAKTPEMPRGTSTSNAPTIPKQETPLAADSPDFHFKKWSEIPEGVIKAAYWNDNAKKIVQAKDFPQ